MTLWLLEFLADGTYSSGAMYSASMEMVHSAACRQVVAPVASCAEIEMLAGIALLGEGVGRNYRCMEDGSGGCLCTFDYAEVGGQSGNWHTSVDGKLFLQSSYAAPNAPAPQGITYCVSDTLALGSEVLLPGQSEQGIAIVLERVNCADGVRGPGEDGVDCGNACQVACP